MPTRLTWRRVFGVIPVPVLYGAQLPEDRAGAQQLMWVRIAPGYEADEGLLMHELHHVEQYWGVGAALAAISVLLGWQAAPLAASALAELAPLMARFGWPPEAAGAYVLAHIALVALLGGHGLLYRFSRTYRLVAEVAAFRVQMRYWNGETDHAKPRQLTLERAAELLARPVYRLGISLDEARAALTG